MGFELRHHNSVRLRCKCGCKLQWRFHAKKTKDLYTMKCPCGKIYKKPRCNFRGE